MEKMLNNFIEDLKKLFNERLSSVFLYGSCAVGECENSFSDINLMVIVKDLCASDLKSANPIINKVVKETKSLPIFMDKDEWFNSSDVYAIECSDIQDRHKILFGENLITVLNIERNDIRLQCEREVKNLLIRLRQAYLSKTKDKNALKNVIKFSSKSFVIVFRTILKLCGETVPKIHKDVIKCFSEKIKSHGIDFDCDMFLRIFEFRENSRVIKDGEIETVISNLIDTTNSVLKYVDKL